MDFVAAVSIIAVDYDCVVCLEMCDYNLALSAARLATAASTKPAGPLKLEPA